MISQHLKDRFFQRYGFELTPPLVRELRERAAAPNAQREPDPHHPDREHVTFYWRGYEVRVVWAPERRFILTVLPQRGMAFAECAPKKRRGRGRRR